MSDGLTMIQRFERTGSFLPQGVAYAVSNGRNGLRMITYADLLKERKARQARHLAHVTAVPRTRWAAFVWVFWTPGLCGFAYRGWWAYLRTLSGDTALDFRGFNRELIQQAMLMFPCGIFPQAEYFELWKEAFAAEHRRPGRFKKQGLAPVWVQVEDGHTWLEPV